MSQGAVRLDNKEPGPAVRVCDRLAVQTGFVCPSEPGEQGDPIRAELLCLPAVPALGQRAVVAQPAARPDREHKYGSPGEDLRPNAHCADEINRERHIVEKHVRTV